MNKKYKQTLQSIVNRLYDLNQKAVKDNDEDVKIITCNLVETLHGYGINPT